MTKNELEILDGMLERLSDIMGNAGCNDYELPDTPENRELVTQAHHEELDFTIRVYKGMIQTTDWVVLGYLRKKLRGANHVAKHY
jgi:hypothetical protein